MNRIRVIWHRARTAWLPLAVGLLTLLSLLEASGAGKKWH